MFALKRSAFGFLAAFAIVLGAPVGAQADDPPAPSVIASEATTITETTATFHAKVNPNATVTTGYFVYGTAPSQLTQRTPEVAVGSGSGEITMDAPVTQLSANTKYYVVAVAENEDWVVNSDTVSFSTLALPWILAGSVSDITYKSATLHLNYGVPAGQSGVVLGVVRRDGGVATRLGPYMTSASGETVVPLTGLEAGAGYSWSVKVAGFGGEASSIGTFRTDPLMAVPSPMLTPSVATYGSSVTISGTIPSRPGLAVTLAAQAFPFAGPIGPLVATTATTDATGAYVFTLRAERPVAYGIAAEGVVAPSIETIAKLKVAPAVTAKVKHARRHRFVVAGGYQPAIASKVSLYRRGAGRVGVARTSKGTFRFPARVLKPGKYEVRITPAAATGFEKAKSVSLTVPRR